MTWQEVIVKVSECAMWVGVAWASAWAAVRTFR